MSERKVYTVPEHKEPDHNAKKRKGTKWCTYEGKWQKFKPKNMGGYMSYPRCEGCGISTEDFWIKMANNDWGMPDKDKMKPKGR